MTMFLKSGENLSIENPTEEQFFQIFNNLKKDIYCLSNDRRVGSIYSEYAENFLSIKRKTANTYQISIQQCDDDTSYKTAVTVVDLRTAVKIAHAYSLNKESWRELSEWQYNEESIFGLIKGFFEIVLKPSKFAIISLILIGCITTLILIFLEKNFTLKYIFLFFGSMIQK